MKIQKIQAKALTKVSTETTSTKLRLNFEILTKTTYVEDQSAPEHGLYFFAYQIKIRNLSESTAQLISRHWIITDGYGRREEVQGTGVVGIQPLICAGQEFEYESACPLNTPTGVMRGTYQMKQEDGTLFDVEIPEFHLISPFGLH